MATMFEKKITTSLRKIVRQTYGDIYYKEYMIDEYDE